MTRSTNARIAGFTFLFYIALGVTQMVVGSGASAGDGPAARLASMAQHSAQVRVNMLLGLVTTFTALALALSLHAITRDEDRDLSAFALTSRLLEVMTGALSPFVSLGLLWLATERRPVDVAGASAVAAFLFHIRGLMPTVGATFFAVGSAAFCWLLMRGRTIPRALAWLGVAASGLLVVLLPMQLMEMIGSPLTTYIWIPMAAFEIPVGFLLLIKGLPPSNIAATPDSS